MNIIHNVTENPAMTPEYLRELADIIDHAKLWKLPVLEQRELPRHQRVQLDAGVALRRYAAHVEELQRLRYQKRSMLITSLSPSSSVVTSTETPPEHESLRELSNRTKQ